jgi:hypothetical protein
MTANEDAESELLKQMFEEIMKVIREKKIKLESIVQSTIDQESISQDIFNRVYRTLTDYGKKKQWL